MIDVLFLDLGGVVVEIDWRPTLENLGIHNKALQNEARHKLVTWDLHHAFERGHVAETAFFSGMRDLLKIDLSHADMIKAWNSLIVRPLPEIDKIFDLYSGKVPIIALSNTNITHREHMDEFYPILKRFDRVFTSYELGERKPNAVIYQKAAELAGVAPSRALFIDDSLPNVEAAKTQGFHSHQTVNSVAHSLEVIAGLFKVS